MDDTARTVLIAVGVALLVVLLLPLPVMSGMMGDGGMAGMTGNQDADRMFLRMTIPHHQLAIDMPEDARKNAEHGEITELAREIIADQSAEIAEMGDACAIGTGRARRAPPPAPCAT